MLKISPIRLGLDIGTNSVGWAVIECRNDDACEPCKILAAGARVFPRSVDGAVESGKEVSLNQARRAARQHRRLAQRRARRLLKIARLLQSHGLLPPGDLNEQREAFFNALDRQLREKEYPHTWLYRLRAKALDEPLFPYALGRALYHLAQRRGFLSNRKTEGKEQIQKEQKNMKTQIHELEKKIIDAKCRTLGEYLSKLDPQSERIRSRWTSRRMYQEEFEALWEAQKRYHPHLLTDDFKKQLHKALFYQRPLKNQKFLVGKCTLEPKKRRARKALLISQEFRIHKTLNNLYVVESPRNPERPLAPEEKEKLLQELQRKKSISWSKIKQLLKLSKETVFNLEKQGEKHLKGNQTAASIIEVVGEEQWNRWNHEEQEQIVHDLLSFEKEEALKKRARNKWDLTEKQAKDFSKITLEEGYLKYSQAALRKLLPELKKGISENEAIHKLYPSVSEHPPVQDVLPPFVERFSSEIRNPLVLRALSETRKVVNAVIAKWGKPAFIHVELARDLKRNRREREEENKKNRKRQAKREQIQEELKKHGIDPSREDIEKYLLWEECNETCPYTGKKIALHQLFGPEPEFEVEHIWPIQRSLDDSFLNKTLCHTSENKNKGNRTPWEAYHDTPRWDEIIHRVKNFKGDARDEKLRRFLADAVSDDFVSRQLNDTRYAAKLALKFLGILYGNNTQGVSQDGRRRIIASRGGLTGLLRKKWELNKILNEENIKSRDDHRHHALDAIVVAATDHGFISRIQNTSKRNIPLSSSRIQIPSPWEGFHDQVRDIVPKILVSHRPRRKVNAQLHDESFYSPKSVIRKPLSALTQKQVSQISDPYTQNLIKEKLKQTGEKDPGKVFKDPQNLPTIRTQDRVIPIKNVKIVVKGTLKEIGSGPRRRWVLTSANHHVAVFEEKNGEWSYEIVTNLEALQRLARGEPIVREDQPGKKFLFALFRNDVIELQENGVKNYYVVRTFSGRNVEYVKISESRKQKEIKTSKEWIKKAIKELKDLEARKVYITPIGEIRYL